MTWVPQRLEGLVKHQKDGGSNPFPGPTSREVSSTMIMRAQC